MNRGLGRLTTAKSESNLFLLAKSELASRGRAASLGDVHSQNVKEGMRQHITRLKSDVEQERNIIKQLKREKILEVRSAREDERNRAVSEQNEFKMKLMQKTEKEIEKMEKDMQREMGRDLRDILKKKDEQLLRAHENFEAEKTILIQTLSEQLRAEAREDFTREFDHARKKLETELFSLTSENKKLEEEIKNFKVSDRQKADDIRQIHSEHKQEMEKLKRDARQENRQQLAEMKQMQNVIEQLEKKLGMETGTCLRLQMEKESLDEALSRLKRADSWEKRWKAGTSGRGIGEIELTDMTLPPRLASKPHNDPERILHRKTIELSSLVRRLDEKNQQLAARNQELMDEVEDLQAGYEPFQEKTRRLGAKNMELVQTTRRQEDRIKALQEEIIALRERTASFEELANRKDKQLSKINRVSKVEKENAEQQKEELDTLRSAVQEQLQIIAELRQQSVEKERRLDVIKERLQRKQSKKKRRSRSVPSPDSLGGRSLGEDSLSNISQTDASLDDVEAPFEDENVEVTDHEKMAQLAKEHIVLQRSYSLLQDQVGGTMDPERIQLSQDALQSDLLVAQARIMELEKQLEDRNDNVDLDKPIQDSSQSDVYLEAQRHIQELEKQLDERRLEMDNMDAAISLKYGTARSRPGFQEDRERISAKILKTENVRKMEEDRQRLKEMNTSIHDKLLEADSELVTTRMEVRRLKEDLKDSEDQRDLLEFRVTELEQLTQQKPPEPGTLHLTDDDKMNLTQEIEEISCDAISVRIALKELEITRQHLLTPKEKNTLIQARALVDKGEKEMNSLQNAKKLLRKRIKDLERKYQLMKKSLSSKEEALEVIRREKIRQEEQALTATDDIFRGFKASDTNKDFNWDLDPRQLLFEAEQKVLELENTNKILNQRIRKLEDNQSQRIDLSDEDLTLLHDKVQQLREAEKQINILEATNLQLRHRIKEIETDQKTSKWVDEALRTGSMPEYMVKEIEGLKEENNQLSEELINLRSRAQEALTLAYQTRQTLYKENRATQTSAPEDIPWNKYMSPRSDYSSPRVPPSSLCERRHSDPGSPVLQTRQEKKERLVFEELVKSSEIPKQMSEPDWSSLDVLDQFDIIDFNADVEEKRSSVNQSSIDALFDYTDNLLQKPSKSGKDSIRKDSISPTSGYADNHIQRALDLESKVVTMEPILPTSIQKLAINEEMITSQKILETQTPGELLDLFFNQYQKQNKGRSDNTVRGTPEAYKYEETLVDLSPNKQAGCITLDPLIALEFDPLTVDTSYVPNEPGLGSLPSTKQDTPGVLQLADGNALKFSTDKVMEPPIVSCDYQPSGSALAGFPGNVFFSIDNFDTLPKNTDPSVCKNKSSDVAEQPIISQESLPPSHCMTHGPILSASDNFNVLPQDMEPNTMAGSSCTCEDKPSVVHVGKSVILENQSPEHEDPPPLPTCGPPGLESLQVELNTDIIDLLTFGETLKTTEVERRSHTEKLISGNHDRLSQFENDLEHRCFDEDVCNLALRPQFQSSPQDTSESLFVDDSNGLRPENNTVSMHLQKRKEGSFTIEKGDSTEIKRDGQVHTTYRTGHDVVCEREADYRDIINKDNTLLDKEKGWPVTVYQSALHNVRDSTTGVNANRDNVFEPTRNNSPTYNLPRLKMDPTFGEHRDGQGNRNYRYRNRLRSRSLSPIRPLDKLPLYSLPYDEYPLLHRCNSDSDLDSIIDDDFKCGTANKDQSYVRRGFLPSVVSSQSFGTKRRVRRRRSDDFYFDPKTKPKRTPPPTLPKPKRPYRQANGFSRKDLTPDAMQKEINMLREECGSLERQLKLKRQFVEASQNEKHYSKGNNTSENPIPGQEIFKPVDHVK